MEWHNAAREFRSGGRICSGYVSQSSGPLLERAAAAIEKHHHEHPRPMSLGPRPPTSRKQSHLSAATVKCTVSCGQLAAPPVPLKKTDHVSPSSSATPGLFDVAVPPPGDVVAVNGVARPFL